MTSAISCVYSCRKVTMSAAGTMHVHDTLLRLLLRNLESPQLAPLATTLSGAPRPCQMKLCLWHNLSQHECVGACVTGAVHGEVHALRLTQRQTERQTGTHKKDRASRVLLRLRSMLKRYPTSLRQPPGTWCPNHLISTPSLLTSCSHLFPILELPLPLMFALGWPLLGSFVFNVLFLYVLPFGFFIVPPRFKFVVFRDFQGSTTLCASLLEEFRVICTWLTCHVFDISRTVARKHALSSLDGSVANAFPRHPLRQDFVPPIPHVLDH